MPLTNRSLSNGIRLITEPIVATKTAAIGFWFSRGSRDERLGEYGITHFIEHMLFKGTSKRSSFEIARFFDRIGGYINAFTERELMCVYCVIPAQFTGEAIGILKDMLSDSLFAINDITKERTVIISEILAAQDEPEEVFNDIANGEMYPDHGISRPIAGSINDVERLDAKQILEFYNGSFKKAPPLVTMAGNIQTEDIIALLESYPIDPGCLPVQDSLVPTWRGGHSFLETRFGQTQLFLTYPLAPLKSGTDWFSWSIINAIIGDTVSSRLFQSLREKNGLCYSLYSTVNVNRDSYSWSAYVATPLDKTSETIDVLMKEIDIIRCYGFSDVEITDAKSHLAGEMLLSMEDIENRMRRLARQFIYNGVSESIEDSLNTLATIPANHILDCVISAFIPANESLVVFTAKKMLKECKKKWP